MVPLLIDENFNHRILRGLRLRLPELNYQLVQEVEVFQKEDPEVLDWATTHNRVVVTHDVNTMVRYAYVRLEAGQPLSGVVVVPKELAIGSAIDQLVILLTCCSLEEFSNRVIHLPI
jgi:predicted nuclease of predicted toxin-antitoxin system